MDYEKIQLEDLVDIIDDASQETDALLQEMMGVRVAFQYLRTGEEEEKDLKSCLLKRYDNYLQYVSKKDKLTSTIQRCIDNLDVIMLKIQNQSDRSAKTLQTMTNFENEIIIEITIQEKTN